MKALTLCDARQFEIRQVPDPIIGARDVLVRMGGIGLCGTDFHIFEGHANYHTDSKGCVIPLSEHPQILGHEICGTVAEVGSEVHELKPGDRVVMDQGLNCSSRALAHHCEYCATGNTHQCADYIELGITGRPGGMAEFIAVPAVNTVKIESDLSLDQAAMSEPMGCIVHSCEMMMRVPARYTFGGERPIRNVLICGAGPAGLLFTQYLRNVIGFDGMLIVTEPNLLRRALVESFGATVIDPTAIDLVEAVNELTHGEKIHYLIESAGVAQLFRQMPGLIRKQATILLYGHGHHGVDLGVLNNVQYVEPTFISPVGASGALDEAGRPVTYRRALELISSGTINVSKLITHRYHKLEDIPQGFLTDRFADNYIKGVAVL